MSGTNPDSTKSPPRSPNKAPDGTSPKSAKSVDLGSAIFQSQKSEDGKLEFSSVFINPVLKADESLDVLRETFKKRLDLGVTEQEKSEMFSSLGKQLEVLQTFENKVRKHGANPNEDIAEKSKNLYEMILEGIKDTNDLVKSIKYAPSLKEKVQEEKKEKEEKKILFSDAVNLGAGEIKHKYSWADMVEEDLALEAKKIISADKVSLVSLIRSKAGAAQDSRVLIPGNLESVLPRFFERINMAAKLAGCQVIVDGSVKIELARPEIFGSDEVARMKVIDSLRSSEGRPTEELLAAADLAVLIETMLEIPDVASINVTGPGKLGLLHTMSLLMRIYCEQKYTTPIAQQRNWWKGGAEVRNKMRDRLTQQLGNLPAANCILNCFDILYRKFIRSTLTGKNKQGQVSLDKIAKDLGSGLFNSGGALFTNLFHTETRVRKVEVVVPVKGGKTRKEMREEKRLVQVRPSITDGPKTPFEKALYAKVSEALSRVDSLAEDYNFSSKKYSSPKDWEAQHKTWVDGLYQRVKFPSALMTERKKQIRQLVIVEKQKNLTQNAGQSVQIDVTKQKITSAEWSTAEGVYMASIAARADSETINAISNMLGASYTKEELISLTESDIRVALGNI